MLSGRLVEADCCRLAVYEAGLLIFDRPVEGFPCFAHHLLVGCDSADGRHSERMCLDAHVGCEFASLRWAALS